MRNFLKFIAYPIIAGVVIGLILLVANFLVDRYKTTRKVSAIIEGPFAFAQIYELFDKAKTSFRFERQGFIFPITELLKPNCPNTEPLKPGPVPAPTNLTATASVNVSIEDLQVYKVTIRNTGNSPIKELPLRFVFENATERFMIFAVKHKTNPVREFGEIKEDFTDKGSPRFVYQLLNPGDEDVISLLTSEKRELKTYAKGEGVSFDVTSASEKTSINWVFYLALSSLIGILLGTVASIIGKLYNR